MTHLVVDASAWIDLLRGEQRWEQIASIVSAAAVLHVPALCDVEVVSCLRKLIRTGQLDRLAAEGLLADYLAGPIQRHDHEPLLQHMLGLGDNFTAYDAAYVVLTEVLDATLVTSDSRLARAAHDLRGVSTAP